MRKSDLRSSCFMRESSDSFLLKGDHFKALDLENDPFYLVRNRNDKRQKPILMDELD